MSITFTTVPAKTLYQPLLSTDVTFKLADITGFSGSSLTASDFGTVGYGVILNSDRSVMELFSWDPTTIASTSISFVARGLPFTGSGVSVTAYKLDWPAGSTVLLGSDTPQFIQWLKDYIDGIAIAGAPDASTTAKGIVEEATQAEVDAGTAAGSTAARLFINPSTHRGRQFNDYAVDSVGTDSYAITITPAITAYAAGQFFTFKAGTANTGAATLNVSGLGAKTIKKNVTDDLATGDILANQIVIVQFDGTNMQLISRSMSLTPTVQTFNTSSTTKGDTTTRFDITNPSGTTFRYTYDGTGTDPNITAITMPTGIPILIESSSMNSSNTGYFIVTGSGANYFEITIGSGVAENDKTLANGYLKTISSQTYTKPTGLKYIILEVQGAGAAGQGVSVNSSSYGAGGGGGAYSKKIIPAGSLGSTETLYVGPGGVSSNTSSNLKYSGSSSIFGSIITAPGGIHYRFSGVSGGVASGGDLNINGGDGGPGGGDLVSSGVTTNSGIGGGAFLGNTGGGKTANSGAENAQGYGAGGSGAFGNASSSANAGGSGASGIIIVTEFY